MTTEEILLLGGLSLYLVPFILRIYRRLLFGKANYIYRSHVLTIPDTPILYAVTGLCITWLVALESGGFENIHQVITILNTEVMLEEAPIQFNNIEYLLVMSGFIHSMTLIGILQYKYTKQTK